MSKQHHSPSYRQAGVNIQKGDSLVQAIKNSTQRTAIPGCMGTIGGFGALFDLKKTGLTDPILVSCTDGVGTKLLAAIALNQHDTIGIDLVAMSVNDLAVQGAIPLFFLDYIASSHLDSTTVEALVEGIATGCHQADCALTGGEMAEMPGMYQQSHYDLAGFCVGAAQRNHLLPKDIQSGDTLIALPSSGIHANGFSLVRKIMAENSLNYTDPAPFAPHERLGDILLTPTRIYVPALNALHQKHLIKGAAHITGGGLIDNTPRMLPQGTIATIEHSWSVPPLFTWLAHAGHVHSEEMLRVFNCGIGMVIATNKPKEVCTVLSDLNEHAFILGSIKEAPTAQEKASVQLQVNDLFEA